MPAGLLPIIYLAFIGLGLPDSAIGSAWPTMAPDLGAGVSWVGVVTMIISAGTILSSLQSVRVVERFGTGRVTAVSVGLTAAALAGFSVATEFWQLCLLAIPYGLGAGAVDAALNTYVAVHYESQHMSWLHCMWGVGASGGPLIMAQCLGVGSWSLGFLVLGGLQLAIVIVLTLSLPLWRDKALPRMADDADDAGSGDAEGAPISRRALLRRDGVLAVLICFFCYCALESTCGVWAASYCTFARGIDAQTAASWASLFYIGITVGRGVSGFISLKVSDHNMIRLGQALIALGIGAMLLPLGDTVLLVGLVLVGLGCAPIYPSIIHATPARFGDDVALALTGMQMAFAYVGTLVVSPLFGVIGQGISMELYPPYLLVFLLVMVVAAEKVNALMRRRAA
ncbi:MFS transporter [Collinsella intestinalis]|uniref:MFS transporter n=1 Tax=Collinsella intestinalis TaxID=147207 RepID=UPI00195D8914|nr:MFS transporter [Collinsella intestinalis]MBM6907081.1 MFS transporter [Collinsella intestinalis]